jgi:hypothetical protein
MVAALQQRHTEVIERMGQDRWRIPTEFDGPLRELDRLLWLVGVTGRGELSRFREQFNEGLTRRRMCCSS